MSRAFVLLACVVLAVVVGCSAQLDASLSPEALEQRPPYSRGYPYPHPDEPSNIFPFDYSCPESCSGHGECIGGKCECEEGFNGTACETAVCVNNCGGHGYCDEGKCVCRPGWTGDDCLTTTCPNGCSGNGACSEGVCYCHPEWIGDDCNTPKFGFPNVPRPAAYGYPSLLRLSRDCVLLRAPPVLTVGGADLLTLDLSLSLHYSCLLEHYTDEEDRKAWRDLRPTTNFSLPAGDNRVCGAMEGCCDVRVEAWYRGIDHPFVFINGVGQPIPTPPPPLPGQVDLSYCPALCSHRGVCINYTRTDPKYECVCPEPWIPPCCCSKDREDLRPPFVDPLNDTLGEIEFNHPPCSQADSCSHCTEVLRGSTAGLWVDLKDSKCAWDAKQSHCSEVVDGHVVHSNACRAPGIPKTMLEPKTTPPSQPTAI